MSPATMNWKRGLLRLWAVAAVLWVGVVVYSGESHRESYGIPFVKFLLVYAGTELLLAFIPPLLLLALGYIGLWVGRGFRR